MMKPADQLLPSDFNPHPVWEFVGESEADLPDETFMRPVEDLPVRTLHGRVVGAQLTLANGQAIFGVLGNIDLADPLSTEHFLTVTVFGPAGERFDLARYHDVDYSERDAAALAAFLGLPIESVFPMHYDLTGIAVGREDCIRRGILAVPTSRLTESELIQLSLK